MKAYKLTDSENKTRGKMQWGENVTHTVTETSDKLCTDGWIHFYMDPLIAVLLNPAHVYFENPNLWECETSGEHLHEPLQSGCKTLTTIRQIPLPWVTTTQRIAFAILCAKKLCAYDTYLFCDDVKWNDWADKWLSGEDRSNSSAQAAMVAYTMSASAGYAAEAAAAVNAALASVHVAWAAKYAAHDSDADFILIAKEAMTY